MAPRQPRGAPRGAGEDEMPLAKMALVKQWTAGLPIDSRLS